MDPAGHYNRPDMLRLHVDTSPRPPVIETTVIETNTAGAANSAAAISQLQGAKMNTAPAKTRTAPEPAAANGVLVDPGWLQAHLHDPRYVWSRWM